ncbi:MAG: HAMP domain-containing histidine kinase [Anaerolineae bacterium]|nr:HAMP domain-containing histidine kinase [Anaerolineae bacterium]
MDELPQQWPEIWRPTTPPDRRRSTRSKQYGALWVQDNGPGIASDHVHLLFKEFTRLDKSRPDSHGLGLSIVYRIIEKLGGEVGVKSAPGQGSLFYFTLPGENHVSQYQTTAPAGTSRNR